MQRNGPDERNDLTVETANNCCWGGISVRDCHCGLHFPLRMSCADAWSCWNVRVQHWLDYLHSITSDRGALFFYIKTDTFGLKKQLFVKC